MKVGLLRYGHIEKYIHNLILIHDTAMRVANGHERYVVDVTNNVIDLITKGEVRNIISYKKGY
jgi:hypothetical protein